jgi:3-phosphoshikimate 1-carboxyvinyltransferase
VLIRPAKFLKGEISLPGDKSISHRAAIIAALAEGESRIENYSTGEDCASTIRCLRQLGVVIEQKGTTVVVHGVGKHGFKPPSETLDCGNSGTTMRLMAGVLAGQKFDSVLTGDDSLRKRPMRRVIEPLSEMGAGIDSEDGLAPLRIKGRRTLTAINYRLPLASAQIKSCVLLAGLFANGSTTVIENAITRDHTERMLRLFGVDVAIYDRPIMQAAPRTVQGNAILKHQNINIPGDISSAAFFLVAAACLRNSYISLPNVGLNPTRDLIFEVLWRAGVNISIGASTTLGEPSATVSVTGGINDADPIALSSLAIPLLIDEIPILAILGTQLDGGLEVRDANELRVKETDRIAAVVENLRRMKATVEEFDDGFRVERSHLQGAEINSFGDHRIAMAFAVSGLLADGETKINDAECADISFPGFFETLDSVVKR